MSLYDDIKAKEKLVQERLDFIYELVEKNKAEKLIRIAYANYLKEITELYALFFSRVILSQQRGEITKKESEKQQILLNNQMHKEVLDVAVVLDNILELE